MVSQLVGTVGFVFFLIVALSISILFTVDSFSCRTKSEVGLDGDGKVEYWLI